MLDNPTKVLAILLFVVFFGVTGYLTVNAVIDCGWWSLLWGKNVFWASLLGACN